MGSVLEAIGQTPLVALNRLAPAGQAKLLLKLEYYSPGASMKDRIARQMVEDAERAGKLKPGATVLECTSGNTGIGLAVVCAVKGYRMVAVMSAGNSAERRHLLTALGARVELVPQAGTSEPGKVSKEDLELVVQRAEALTQELGAFRADQFNNPSNPRAHELGTAQEIWDQTGGRLAAFVAAVGTSGLFTGVARGLKARKPSVKCYVVEPGGAPFLAGRPVTNSRHKLQGIGYAMKAGFWDPALADGYLTVSDEVAIDHARRLARLEGIIAGYSTGANVAAALQVARRLPPQAVVVTVACDSGMKYLSADLFEGLPASLEHI